MGMLPVGPQLVIQAAIKLLPGRLILSRIPAKARELRTGAHGIDVN